MGGSRLLAALRWSLASGRGQCIWVKGRRAPRASASDSMLRRVASKAAEEERPPRSSSRREVPRREARGGEPLAFVGRDRVAAKATGEASPLTKTLSEAATCRAKTVAPLAR